jgi:predicted outer membrane protein
MLDRSRIIVIAVVLGAVACKHTAYSGTAAGVLSPELATGGLSASEVAAFAAFSKAERVGHVVAGDSMEIAMAGVAAWRTQNGAIEAFANQLIVDHTESLRRVTLIAHQQGLSMEPAPNDTMPAHLLGMVETLNASTPSLEFDRKFLLSQIEMHQHMLAELAALRTMTTDDALGVYLNAAIPMIEGHLKTAQHIAQDLGFFNTH